MQNPQEIYSNYKFLYFNKILEALKKKKIVSPVHVRIKPINKCNHDCWYCAYRVSNVQLGDQMQERDMIPYEKLNEIAEDIIDMEVKALTFSGGGEPLLYKKLPLIIKKLAENGVKVAVLTNGSNLQGNMGESLQKYGTWIRISIDGYDDESYAKARGIKHNAFFKLLENIKNFTSSNSKCVVGCVIIVGHNNYNKIYELCKKLKNVGVSNVKISGVVIGNKVDDNNKYHIKIKDVVISQLAKCKNLVGKNFSIINHYHDLNSRFDKSYVTCPFIFYRPVIGADCKVYSCQDKAYTRSGMLGSIEDISFKEFWFSKETRDKIYKHNPSLLCKHHCISHLKNELIHEYLRIDKDHLPFT